MYCSLFFEAVYIIIKKRRIRSTPNKVCYGTCSLCVLRLLAKRPADLLRGYTGHVRVRDRPHWSVIGVMGCLPDRLSIISRLPAINLYRLLRGYVWLAADPGPDVYFTDLTRWDNITHDAINAIMTWIGDSLVVSISQIADRKTNGLNALLCFDMSDLPMLSSLAAEDRYRDSPYYPSYHQHW